MEKTLEKLEFEYTELCKELYDEVSKLQIEEKFLERQAQTLIDEIRKNGDEKVKKILDEMIDMNDPDLILQNEHLNHMESLNEDSEEHKVREILIGEFGFDNPESYAYSTIPK